MVKIDRHIDVKLPKGIEEIGLTKYYSDLASVIYRRGLSKHQSDDSLFSTRKEIRYCIDSSKAMKLFDELLESTGMEEKIWSDPWVQNIYCDTRILGLPLGFGFRARQNKEYPSQPDFVNETAHIELTCTSFDCKDKIRTDTSLHEILCDINSIESVAHGKLEPYLASSYLRRPMQSEGIRINVDNNIRGFWALPDMKYSEFKMPDVSVFEVKFAGSSQLSKKAIDLIEAYGAIPAPGKHYKLYSESIRASLEDEKKFGTKSFPGYEYEVKMDALNDLPFKNFTEALYSGRISWLKPLYTVPTPFIRETINEYRILNGTTARFTYNGTLKPRAVIKNRGEFLYGSVLKRTEEEVHFEMKDVCYIKSLPLVGVSKRAKEFIETLSASGNHYSVSVDRNIKADNGALYQIEVEYRSSLNERASEDAIAEEIRRIAGIFISNWEARLSKTRKEDWVRWME